MFKNKDGSYNKVQILIVSLITLIGICILVSSGIPTSDTQPQDLDLLFIIIGILAFVIAGFIGFRILIKRKHVYKPYVDPPTKNDIFSLQLTEPVIDMRRVEEGENYVKDLKELELKLAKSNKQTSSGTGISAGMIFGIVSLIVGGITLLIASSVVNSMVSAMPQIQENSEWSSTFTTTTNNVAQAFNIMGFMIPLIVAGFFIITMFKMIRI